MPSKPTTIDEYLATVTKEQRAALEKVRQAIHKAAPNAEECINYGVPAFRLDGLVFPHERLYRRRVHKGVERLRDDEGKHPLLS